MKLAKALFVLALALVVASPAAYAETQNVKVSGSIDAYAFMRANYDLNDDGGSVDSTGTVGSPTNTGDSDTSNYFMSQTQVEVSADLTDNVSTVINLLNERDWVGDDNVGGVTGGNGTYDIGVDLAYVKMKEIFYSPLTLTIGRQDVWFGRGFIIGSNNHAWDTENNINAKEYSASTAFDAIRATLDFNPWTIDFVYSKISEGPGTRTLAGSGGDILGAEDDIDLYVTNVNYKFAEYNAVAEGYFVTEWDRANAFEAAAANTAGNQKSSETYVVGGRVQFDPISQITLGGELAYQFGEYFIAAGSANARDRDAWAANLFGTYRFDNVWKPEVTLEYVHFSGESDTVTASGDYGAWNGLYRGKFWTAYADFREFIYNTDRAGDTSATQNQDMIQVKGSLKPLEDLLLEGSFSWFWAPDDEFTTGNPATGTLLDDEIGWEIDLQATYDYTEDVSFGILAGWFVPGDRYAGNNDEHATDIVSSVKVTF